MSKKTSKKLNLKLKADGQQQFYEISGTSEGDVGWSGGRQ